MRTRILEVLGIILLIAAALVGSFFLADYVQSNGTARQLVEHFGYLGIFLVALLIGLNLFLPVPAATFTPIFVSAGLPIPGIIVTLVLGALVADTIGYLIGLGGRHITRHTSPALQKKMQSFAERHHALLLPFVFLYSPPPGGWEWVLSSPRSTPARSWRGIDERVTPSARRRRNTERQRAKGP